MKRFSIRRLWPDPQHGMARGAAAFGGPSAKGSELGGCKPSCSQLRRWSVEHGLLLDNEPESLTPLDQHLDSWNANPAHHERVNLPVEVGVYLGDVIVSHVNGSQWKTWPDGHPIVQLRSGSEFDVTAMASERLNHTGASLDAIYRSSRTQSRIR